MFKYFLDLQYQFLLSWRASYCHSLDSMIFCLFSFCLFFLNEIESQHLQPDL
ncbi:hypothetical protein [Aquimarina hainanensis]|uniref:hypothetical protein n=1 Tax=Aquimarina hainanensis TaxID=1578017 RepID=UPI00361AC8FF